jgi:nitrogen fixation/metabolism regulation signal transduction histidine kinase
MKESNLKINSLLFLNILIVSLLTLIVFIIAQNKLNLGRSTSHTLSKIDENLNQIQKELVRRKAELKGSFSGRSIYKKVVKSREEVASNRKYFAITREIEKDFIKKTMMISILIFLLLLLINIFLIRKKYNKLLNEFKKNELRDSELNSLRKWQKICQTLIHEIKNPLTPFLLISKNLDKQNNSQLKKSKDILQTEISRLKGLIKYFSDFSNLPDTNLKTVALKEIIKHIQKHLHNYSNVLHYQDKPLSPPDVSIKADLSILSQVYLNIFNNIAEANPAGCIVDLETITHNNSVQIKIHNDGEIMKIDTSRKTKLNFGIGLRICEKIMLDHQGRFEVKNENERVVYTLDFEREHE